MLTNFVVLAVKCRIPLREPAGVPCPPFFTSGLMTALVVLQEILGVQPISDHEHVNRAIAPFEARLLLDQAGVAEVSKQVKLALFYDAQLDLKAME